MRVLVTGARGLLGSQLVPALRAQGHDVFATDVHLGSDERYQTWDVTAGMPDRAFDFWPEVIYHLAAVCGRVVAEENPGLATRTNVAGAQHVAQAASDFGARLIHLSTSEVYGDNPETETSSVGGKNWYGATKSMGEMAVNYWCPSATIVRPFMMYHESEPFGPHRSFMIRAAHAVKHGEELTLHRGAKRSWLHMSDAVRWLIEMMDERFAGHTINIGSVTPPVSNEWLVGALEGAFGKTAKTVTVEMPERIRAVKTPDLTKQKQMLSPQQVSLLDGINRLARFMDSER